MKQSDKKNETVKLSKKKEDFFSIFFSNIQVKQNEAEGKPEMRRRKIPSYEIEITH